MNDTTPSTATLNLNTTMRKFGAPQTVIHQYQYWSILLRPAQITLGSLVLVAHEPVQAFSKLSLASFTEFHKITQHIELSLEQAFQYNKINYLMLMMVDPDVHFHIVPRYAQAKQFNKIEFVDHGWPGAPNLSQTNKTDIATNQLIMNYISSYWAHE